MALKISHLLLVIQESLDQLKKLSHEKPSVRNDRLKYSIQGQITQTKKKLDDMGMKNFILRVEAYVPYLDLKIDCFYSLPKLDPLGNSNEYLQRTEIELMVRWHYKIKADYPFEYFKPTLYSPGKNINS